MIATVACEYHWPPAVIGGLFIDAWPLDGLDFWYQTVKDTANELENLKDKK